MSVASPVTGRQDRRARRTEAAAERSKATTLSTSATHSGMAGDAVHPPEDSAAVRPAQRSAETAPGLGEGPGEPDASSPVADACDSQQAAKTSQGSKRTKSSASAAHSGMAEEAVHPAEDSAAARRARRSSKRASSPGLGEEPGEPAEPPPLADEHDGQRAKPTETELSPEEQAIFIRRKWIALALSRIVGFNHYVNGLGCVVFMDQVFQDAGNPEDPVERILLEQVAFQHLLGTHLHGVAETVGGLEAQRLYHEIGVRVGGECRKTALALQTYRGQKAAQGRRPAS